MRIEPPVSVPSAPSAIPTATAAAALLIGLLCWLVMIPLRRVLSERQIWICGILGAICHNIGQILVCIAVYQTTAVLVYLPVLMLSGIVTGLFTGLAAYFLQKGLRGRL